MRLLPIRVGLLLGQCQAKGTKVLWNAYCTAQPSLPRDFYLLYVNNHSLKHNRLAIRTRPARAREATEDCGSPLLPRERGTGCSEAGGHGLDSLASRGGG